MLILLCISVHKSAEICNHRIIIKGKIGLEVQKIGNIIGELGADLAVQICGDVSGGSASHADQTALIAAGCIAKHFDGNFHTGFLDRMDQSTGAQKVMSKAKRLSVADFLRTGAVVAENNVAHFTRQRSLYYVLRQAHIICY